jgi:putative transposase
MILNDPGRMVETEWLALKNRFPNIELHEHVVMPNHFHGIIEIKTKNYNVATVGAPLVGALDGVDTTIGIISPNGQPQGIAPTVGDMIDAFKSIITVKYIHGVKKNGWKTFDHKLWQRNYWEHIIRNDDSLNRIAGYISNNPLKWNNDQLNPDYSL